MRYTASVVVTLLIASTAFAATVSITEEYTYQANAIDTEASSRTIARTKIRRLLLKEFGKYLMGKPILRGFQLTDELIATLASGIVNSETIEDRWDGKACYLKGGIMADPGETADKVAILYTDTDRGNDLKMARIRTEKALEEIDKLNSEIEAVKRDKGKQGQYIQAIKELEAVAYFEMGFALSLSGQYDEAIGNFTRAIELSPRYAGAYKVRGVAYFDSGRFKQAIKDCDKAIKLDSGYADAYFHRGNGFYKMGNFKQAIKDYDMAIRLNPGYTWAYNNRADAFSEMGLFEQAMKDYNMAVRLDPEFAKAYHHRGKVYYNLGDIDMAIDDYTRAIELNPQYTMVYYHRGIAYEHSGKLQHALKDFQQAVKLNPEYAEAYFGRAVVYEGLGAELSAIQNYKIAARLGMEDARQYLKSKGIEW